MYSQQCSRKWNCCSTYFTRNTVIFNNVKCSPCHHCYCYVCCIASGHYHCSYSNCKVGNPGMLHLPKRDYELFPSGENIKANWNCFQRRWRVSLIQDLLYMPLPCMVDHWTWVMMPMKRVMNNLRWNHLAKVILSTVKVYPPLHSQC